MDILSDEHEREEAVRKWWHEHWKPIALGIAIAIGGLIGVRQYQAYQLEQSQQDAYAAYQLQSQILSRGTAAFAAADQYLQEHEDIYGAMLALDMAATLIQGEKYDEALKYITFARDHGGELTAPQASLVLARLQGQSGDYSAAMATLDGLVNSAYQAEAAEIRGDLFMAQGKSSEAHDAYAQAIAHYQAAQITISPILQMKFDNVIESGDKPAYQIMAEQIEAQNAGESGAAASES